MKQQVNTLNLTDTDGILSTFHVNENIAVKAQMEFARKLANSKNRGNSLEFTHFILSSDNEPIAEEHLCVPVDKIKTLGILRPIRRASMSVKSTQAGNGTVAYYAKRAGKRPGGFFAALQYMLNHPQLLTDKPVNADSFGKEMHKVWKVKASTASNYVYRIRSLHKQGKLK